MAVNKRLALYLAAPILLNLGMFIHVLLFNLYLADLGFREDFMGRQAALMTVGTAAGIIGGALATRRRGLRFTGLMASAGVTFGLLWRVNSSGLALDGASICLGL